MSQQRNAAARPQRSAGGQGKSARKHAADHSARNIVLIAVGAVVALSLLGFGAAIAYDRSQQPSSLTAEEFQATAVGGNEARALLVRRHMNENYAGEIWYTSILKYVGDDSTIRLETNLPKEPFGVARAAKICDAVSDYIYGEGRSNARFTRIEVLSIKGETLVSRPDRNTVCTEVRL